MSYKDLKEAIAGALNPSNLRLFMKLEQNLSLVQGFTTTKNQLGDYIRNASDDEIQPLLTYLTTAIEADSELLAPETDTAPKSAERRQWVLEKLGLPVGYRGDRWPQLLETMRRDKKARGTILRFVLLDAVGAPVVTEVPDDGILFAAYQEIGEQSPTTRLGPVSL